MSKFYSPKPHHAKRLSQSLIELPPSRIRDGILLRFSIDWKKQKQGEPPIKHLRLVSKRIMVVRATVVCLITQSFSWLDDIPQHPHFQKFISKATIDVFYHDVELVRSRQLFAQHRATNLVQILESTERCFGCGPVYSKHKTEEYQRLLASK